MKIDPHTIATMVSQALAEDVGSGDVSAELVPINKQVSATVITRQPMVMCGQAWVDAVVAEQAGTVECKWLVAEGDWVGEGAELLCLSGEARAILTAERTALNFLQALSAVATTTRIYVDAVAGAVDILDTRKTLPGWRLAQKYAVKVGGGQNHRFGLYDAYLIKENHIIACGGIAEAVEKARRLQPDLVVQVEVESLDELQQALAAGVDKVLLDNFDFDMLTRAVAKAAGRTYLEASGNVDLSSIHSIAKTGVDGVSIGGLTKHIHAIDLSLRVDTDA